VEFQLRPRDAGGFKESYLDGRNENSVVSADVSDPKPGIEWSANFYRATGLGNDEKRKFLAWNVISEGRTFHAPNYFGILRLVK